METKELEKDLEVVKFNITDATIETYKTQYLPLTIAGLEDKEGYKAVHDARMIIKGKRVEVDARRKVLNEDALKYQRTVNAEAKRITGLLDPIEAHLANEEYRIDKLKEAAQLEKEKLEQAKLQERVSLLIKNGCSFDGNNYTIAGLLISSLDLKVWAPDKFETFIQAVIVENEKDLAIKAAETKRLEEIKLENERLRKEEADRLAKDRLELEQLRKEQAAREVTLKADQERIDLEQKTREDKIKADQEAIAKQQKEIEDARILKEALELREIELKQASERVIAAEKEKQRAADEEKIKADQFAKEKADRDEALRPDKEKLQTFASDIVKMKYPDLKDPAAKEILLEVTNILKKASNYILNRIGTL